MSIVKSYSFPEGEIRGNMYYIKHNTNNFTVIDCYLKDGEGRNARKDEIVNEIKRESLGRICRFISTHPDKDHILGIDYLDEKWKILNFYAVENNIPTNNDDTSLSRYHWLKENKNFPIVRGIKRSWLNNSNQENKSSGIFFHWPNVNNEEFKKALNSVKEGNKVNYICPIFTYRIEEGATYMWMGDLETKMQEEYYKENEDNIPKVHILFQPHHGRKTGAVPKELLDKLNPKIIIIGNAPCEYIKYGDSHCTITQNTSGDILFDNVANEVHIYTKNKIDNIPTCLKNKQGLDNIIKEDNGVEVIDWYYIGTLMITEE